MTETINLVDTRYKFIEKDLSSSGSVIVEIDGWMNTKQVREELALRIQLDYTALCGEKLRVFLNLTHF